jgi:Zn-dependent protease with chaperone function
MDRAARNFFALVGIGATLGAYAICGFIAYVLIPAFGVDRGAFGRFAALWLLPAIVLTALFAVAVGRAVRTLRGQVSASRRLSRRIQAAALAPAPQLRAAVGSPGLDGRVTLIDAAEPFSFVYGVFVPRVAISRGFHERLSAEELGAALEHERYHVRNLDPLRALIGAVLIEAFFLLPALEVLRARYEAGRELAADRRAERACGSRPLLGALLKALEEPGREPAISASLADPGFLDARVFSLETGQAPRLAVPSFSNLAWSALGTGAFVAVFVAAVIGIGGSAALAGAVADELRASRTLLGALCLAPVIAVVALAFWRLSRRARRPLAPASQEAVPREGCG